MEAVHIQGMRQYEEGLCDRLEFVVWLATQTQLFRGKFARDSYWCKLLLVLYVIHGYMIVLGKGTSTLRYVLSIWKATHEKKA